MTQCKIRKNNECEVSSEAIPHKQNTIGYNRTTVEKYFSNIRQASKSPVLWSFRVLTIQTYGNEEGIFWKEYFRRPVLCSDLHP